MSTVTPPVHGVLRRLQIHYLRPRTYRRSLTLNTPNAMGLRIIIWLLREQVFLLVNLFKFFLR